MTSQARKTGPLDPLFDLQKALDESLLHLPDTSQPNSQTHGNDAVTSLARAALSLLAGKSVESGGSAPRVSEQYVDAFCRVLVIGKLQEALSFVHAFASRGAQYSDIAEDLFAAAARRLGDRWVSDQSSMVDVNVGVATLVRTHVAMCSNLAEPEINAGGSALFVSFRGQAHTLGLTFAAEYFRQNGWRVRYIPAATLEECFAAVLTDPPDIVGLTAAMDTELDLLRSVIERLKQAPGCPRVILGGTAPGLASLEASALVSRLDVALLAGRRLLGSSS